MFLFIIIGIVSAIIAAAGPTWQEKEMPAMYKQNPIMIALEMSSEMEDDDITPSRLTRAKYFIEDILTEIPESQTALVIYTSEPFMVSPLSEDASIIENLLPAIDFDIIPVNGNRADRTIDFAAEKMEKSGFMNGNIILITSDSGTNTKEAILSAKKAAASGYNVNIVEISHQENDILKQVARAGNGSYVNINNNPSRLISKIKGANTSDFSESQNKLNMWVDFGYYLLFLPMICCLFMFRRGILLIVFCLMLCENAYAGFFKNKNQEGAENFENQKYEQAAETFEDANWQASSLYRAERYDEAYKKFAKDSSETGLYNQGNALAKGGKIGEAILKYEEVLKINPNHEDAKFNLEYLKKQGGQSSSSSQNDEDNKDDEDNQENRQQQNSSSSEEEQDENSDNQSSDSNDENQDTPPEKNDAQSPENEDEESPQPSQPEDTSEGASQEDSSQKNDAESSNKNSDEKSSDSQNAKPNPLPSEDTEETPPDASASQNEEEIDNQTKEKMLAKAQQYRAIEEDPGGLLRALIEQEYMKKRYKD